MTKRSRPRSDGSGWTSGLTVIKECSFVTKPTVVLKDVVQSKIDLLMEEFQGKEWLAYLIGVDYNIVDLFIPKQSVSTASVSVKDTNFPKGVIGTVHSHHSMGAFDSGVDQEYLEGNHPITIVVADHDWIVKVRLKTPCGHYICVDGDLHVDRGLSDFLEEARSRIEEKVFPIRTAIARDPVSGGDVITSIGA